MGTYISKVYIPVRKYQQEQLRLARNKRKPSRRRTESINATVFTYVDTIKTGHAVGGSEPGSDSMESKSVS